MNLSKWAMGGAVASLATLGLLASGAEAAKMAGAHMNHPGMTHAPAMKMRPMAHPNMQFNKNVGNRHRPQVYIGDGDHRHHRRHFRSFGYGFYAYPSYSYYYSDSCHWLKVRALRTGSRYWWHRYHQCLED